MKKEIIVTTICALFSLCISPTMYADEPEKTLSSDTIVESETGRSLPLLINEKVYKDSIVTIKKQLELSPDDVRLLAVLGRLQNRCKQISEAYATYNKLILLSPKHYEACLFLGTYYYVHGKKRLEKEDARYKEIKNPRRMEYASYQNNIKQILEEDYAIAAGYLESALSLKKTALAQNMLQTVHQRMTGSDANKR